MASTEMAADASVKPSRGARGRRWYGFVIKLAVGLAVLGFLIWHYDLRSTFRVIGRERPVFFIATVMLFVAGQAMSAYRWQLLARLVGLAGSYVEFLSFYFIGMFTNVFVPGLIGGDALRAVYLGRSRGRITDAVASVVADRGIGLIALFWLAGGSALTITRVALPPTLRDATIATGAAALIAFLAAPLAAKMTDRLPRPLARLLSPLLPYMKRPGALGPAIILSLLLQISLAGCQYLLALGLGLDVPLTTFILIVPISNVAASLPLTINGLGVREAAYLVLLGMTGVSKNNSVALSLLYFAATLAGGLTGLVPFIATAMPGE
ncbi:MAG TPA: lysylphosphatidylglycerol synthase transmembrane domain-containing protein [Candidatus Binataceae bacterium]|nr:lysylphosphatidylglycerol synthase transmembrane domain-containing protein [Candidatus Binataceae bacterium]